MGGSDRLLVNIYFKYGPIGKYKPRNNEKNRLERITFDLRRRY